MPAGDRTGPSGKGPMTGRQAGFCSGYTAPGYANPIGRGFGMGQGRGRGGGYGWRNQFFATGQPFWARFGYAPNPPSPEQEAEMLRSQEKGLKEQLDAINKRLSDLEKKD
ncbi:MAG TPA: DUF5320 domain-containing protein [Anaerolineae bacterium]|nr:DUF5320 domain-containing protein [Anaerolineae bacterium]